MNGRRIAIAVAVCCCVAFPCARTVGAGDDVGALLRAMPADFAATVVLVDPVKLDQKVSSVVQRFEPGNTEPGLLADLKKDLGIAEWIDFSQPLGIAVPMIGGGNRERVVWVRVPDFATKAKTLEGATEQDGVWQVPFKKVTEASLEGMLLEGDDGESHPFPVVLHEDRALFVKVRGDYIVAASDSEMLTKATEDGKSLAEDIKLRIGLLKGRDALIHINIDPMRPTMLGGIAQVAQMIPMMAMMAGQQGGVDPAVLTGLVGGAMDGVKGFVEQIASVDVVISLSETAADVTVATAYKEGPIKTYLAKQKPAKVPLLAQLEEQPYVLAGAYHIPGRESPFFDYLIDKVSNAIQSAPTGGGGEGEAAGQAGAIKEAVETSRELFHRLEGQNTIISASSHGLRFVGDYLGENPKTLLELVKKSILTSYPLMSQLNAGAKYEALGSKKVAGVLVEEFALSVDTTDPAAASLLALYGGNPRFVIGIVGDRVRYCMSSDPRLERVFAAKVGKPFTSNRYVAEALAALPARRNMILLVDPAAFLPVIGPMIGKPTPDPIPPGPPIALAVCLAGEPARVDIHVPFRAIERLTQATGRDEPL